jgi:hypothetical protein
MWISAAGLSSSTPMALMPVIRYKFPLLSTNKIKEAMDGLLTLLVTQVPFPIAMKPGSVRSNIHEEDGVSKESD